MATTTTILILVSVITIVITMILSFTHKNRKETTPKKEEILEGDSPKNDKLRQIRSAIEEKNLLIIENRVSEYISTYGDFSIDQTCYDWFDYFDDINGWERFWTERDVCPRNSDPLVVEFIKKIINGEKTDIRDYESKFNLQMQLKAAFDAKDICLFDELLTSGADINYRYNDGSGEYTLYQRVKNYDTSLMYQYFLTRDDCIEINKIRKAEKLIADRRKN